MEETYVVTAEARIVDEELFLKSAKELYVSNGGDPDFVTYEELVQEVLLNAPKNCYEYGVELVRTDTNRRKRGATSN